MTGGPPSTGLTAEPLDIMADALLADSGLPQYGPHRETILRRQALALKALAESGYEIVPKGYAAEARFEAVLDAAYAEPDGDEVEAVAEALYARFPTADPLHLSSGVRWDELSETARRSYRGRAVGLISTLTAYRESSDG